MVILNYHLPHNLEDYWGTSGLKVCADGGALQLFNRNKNLLPDAIQGDFDSVSSEVLDYYREKGVTINQHEDQDTTDLQKCLAFLERTEKETGQVNTSIIVLGGMGGCISHTFANLNTLFLYQHRKLVLVGRKNIALLLRPGLTHVHYHKLQTDEIFCSLVPLGVQSALVTTTGLKWNLSNKELAFGGLVSTSNKIESDQVTIQTNNPILWIIDFDH
uniref:Thiamin pyrophosphokinase thiamin-binding domain-containing protein n=1 Tax=Arcella intermedia TaxID=1963864 RepID=A0A6B2LHG3_9EUKA